jgi:preprotein translocase subunit SecG
MAALYYQLAWVMASFFLLLSLCLRFVFYRQSDCIDRDSDAATPIGTDRL